MTEKEALTQLKADDPAAAAAAEAMLWNLWCRSGHPEVDIIFRAGGEAMNERRLSDAERRFAFAGPWKFTRIWRPSATTSPWPSRKAPAAAATSINRPRRAGPFLRPGRIPP